MYSNAEISEIKKYAVKHICPHYGVNTDLDTNPKVFVKSDDCYIYDIEGRRYLDTFSSLLTTICGHNNKKIINAIVEQINILDFFPNFGDHYCLPMIELTKKLQKILPKELSAFFYVNSGSEANETALKIARQYHVERGDEKRYKVVSRRGSYHGTTLGTVSATGLPWFTEKFTPMCNPGFIKAPAARCARCEFGLEYDSCGMKCLKELENIIIENDPETISAIIMDPLPGSNTGYPVPPEGYLKSVREICDKYGILLIFDEIQTAIGKSGEMFICQYFGVTPDILTISKALTSGYIPLGVTVMRQDIYDLFRSAPGKELRSGSTFGGHNVACAAAIACLDFIEENNLLENVKTISAYIQNRVKELMEVYPFIGAIHGVGLLLAIELCAERKGLKPFDPSWKVGTFVRNYCYENGLIMRNNDDIIVIAPPLTFTKEHVDIMLGTFEKALIEVKKKYNI
ncbi:MAG TPA: aspartate aminotransferase family protein [Clostridiaceae bacterium]|nr:aspartate aminotransferase family protein [Clostridiaceae bacterium]